jgi:hypothetical protein
MWEKYRKEEAEGEDVQRLLLDMLENMPFRRPWPT